MFNKTKENSKIIEKQYKGFFDSSIWVDVCSGREKDLNLLCYCDLEKFFDDNGLEIEIYRNDFNNSWTFRITGQKFVIMPPEYSRQQAKEQAIYKAFEILEEKLNK